MARELAAEILGYRIADLRRMTATELRAEGWTSRRGTAPIVIVLENGTRIYAAQDHEGNGPGALFGLMPDGRSFAM